jgi:hypothetical protein
MKFSTLFIALIAGASAFQPVCRTQTRTSLALKMSNDDDGSILEKAGDAVRDALDRMDNADDMPPPGSAANSLTDEQEKDMWDAQRELQANRSAHSSKESRKEKYSGEPIIENDKHDELKKPWTKSDSSVDHNSIGGKL